MIIDGKLVVSKKKKKDLVAELKQKNFKPFPKVADAAKEGETEPAMEDEDVDEDANLALEANSYDYLLGVSLPDAYLTNFSNDHRWPSGLLPRSVTRSF